MMITSLCQIVQTIHGPTPQNNADSWPFPCSNFNGKEKDHETGFHYYGARYYWSELLTGWLSVDLMMDKYPGISPYAYCTWNPIIMIDPDGNDGRVVVKKANGRTSITISTTVYLRSAEMGRGDLANLAKNAQFVANKFFHQGKPKYFEDYNCEVSFNVQYKIYEDGVQLQPGDNLLNVNPNETDISGVKGTQETHYGLVVGGLAGSEGNINSDICNSRGASKGKGILHETLHFLGLLDRYSGNHSYKGFEKDIMGVDARNATKFDDSHYIPYIEKYQDANMSGNPYILLKERIDVSQTERIKRMNTVD